MNSSMICLIGLLIAGCLQARPGSSQSLQDRFHLQQRCNVEESERQGRAFLRALEGETRARIAERCRRDFDQAVVAVVRAGDLETLDMLYMRGLDLSRDYAASHLLCHVVDAEYRVRDLIAAVDYRQRLYDVAGFLLRRACSRRVVHAAAARPCSSQMARRLIAYGKIEAADQHVLRACCLPVRKELLAAGCLGPVGYQHLLLLESAAYHQGWDLTDLLARMPMPVDCHDERGNTPLHLAVRYRTHRDVSALLAAGASIDARNQAGDTPLAVAVCRGDAALVDLLLAHGADPMVRNQNGQTLLHHAAASGCESVVRRLLMTERFVRKQLAGNSRSAEVAARKVGRSRIADLLREEAGYMAARER